MPEVRADDVEDLKLLRTAALAAGDIARDFYYKDGTKNWLKSDNTPATEADMAVNRFLAETVKPKRPDYGWLSEETKDDASRLGKKRSIVIDPIDGTRAFMDKKPHFTICLAVIEDGKARVGIVFNPITDELFEACKNGGAKLNGQVVHVSGCAQIKGCRIIGYPRKFKRLGWPEMQVSIRNSMAYRIVLVAAGLRDAAVAFTPKSDWDLAAATIIAEEAGAIITDIEGHSFDFAKAGTRKNGVICAGPTLHALLVEQLKSTQPKTNTPNLETKMSDHKAEKKGPEQLLHLVIGGELIDPLKTDFKDISAIEYVGAYPNYGEARKAWKNAAQRTVDNAHMRYFILHAHHLIDPDNDGYIG